MKDSSNQINNAYYPLIFSRFVMSKFTDQGESKHNREPDQNLLRQYENIQIGLIGSILANNAYKDLIE